MNRILPFFIGMYLLLSVPAAEFSAQKQQNAKFPPLSLSVYTSAQTKLEAPLQTAVPAESDSNIEGLSSFSAANRFLTLFGSFSGVTDQSFSACNTPQLKNWYVLSRLTFNPANGRNQQPAKAASVISPQTDQPPTKAASVISPQTSQQPTSSSLSISAGSLNITGAFSRMKNPRFYTPDPLRSSSVLKAGLSHTGSPLTAPSQPVSFFIETGTDTQPHLSFLWTLPKKSIIADENTELQDEKEDAADFFSQSIFAFFYRLPPVSAFSAKTLYCAGASLSPAAESSSSSWYMSRPYHTQKNLPVFHQEISVIFPLFSAFCSVSSSMSHDSTFLYAARTDFSYTPAISRQKTYTDTFTVNAALFVSSPAWRSIADTYNSKIFHAYINPQITFTPHTTKTHIPWKLSAGIVFDVDANQEEDIQSQINWNAGIKAASQMIFPGLKITLKTGIKELSLSNSEFFDDIIDNSTASWSAGCVYAPLIKSFSDTVFSLSADGTFRPGKESSTPTCEIAAKAVFTGSWRISFEGGCVLKQTVTQDVSQSVNPYISSYKGKISVQKKKLLAAVSAAFKNEADTGSLSSIEIKAELSWK